MDDTRSTHIDSPSLPPTASDEDVPDDGSEAEAIDRLRTHVQHAAQAIRRLRAENRRLARRVQELESRPAIEDDETLLALDTDPDALRDTIEGFIETIDRYLDQTESSE